MAEEKIQSRGESRQKVLIAEDEKLLAEAIAVTLDLEGLETFIAYNGIEALDLARELRPDLALLDVMMPGKSGVEVCATLKTNSETSSIPVILVTAKAQEEDRAIGIAAGADGYITKPFSPIQLMDLVRDVLMDESDEPPEPRRDLFDMPADQLVIYARDVKELWEQERRERQELEEAHRRLEKLNQLKSSFVSTVTNELLTPFASIGTTLQVLQRQSDECSDVFQETLDDLSTSIAGLHRRVKGVVKFANLVTKRREPEPGYYTLDQIVPWAVQPVAIMAEARGVDFRVFLPSDLPEIYADPELVGEAVFQMAHNAVKFNQAGGEAQVRAYKSEDMVTIEVSDTGIGLTSEQIAALERPFEQCAESLQQGEGGLGIGWPFVRYVAEVHNGETRVESPGSGQGSTFCLILPVSAEE